MLKRYLLGHAYRTFSRSTIWRNLEKNKPPESPSKPSSQTNPDASMTVVPTEFDKRILLLSGKYKSREEIPARVRFGTMDNAKSRLRIRVASIMMALTVLACIGVVIIGKKRKREGDSLLKRLTDRDRELREEGQKNKLK